MPTVLQRSQHIPSPLAALALGLASLGGCLDTALQLDGMVQRASALLACGLVALVVLKFCVNPHVLRQELAHPILGSVLPTLAMALMIVSVALPASIALPLWCGAVLVHSCLFVAFLRYRLPNLQLSQLIPGWFVPPIGIVTAVATSPDAISPQLIASLFWFGFIAYLLMLPIMLYRLRYGGQLPVAAKPSFAILAAPASLCLTGYLSFAINPSAWLVLPLLLLALLMTAIIYIALPSLLRLPFTPAFAAYTFPLVIGATALFKVSAVLQQWQWSQLATMVYWLAYVELLIATLVCSYVAYRFVLFTVIAPQRQKVLPV